MFNEIRNNKGLATVTIIIIIVCAVVVLGGAIGGIVAYNVYQEKKQEEAEEEARRIEEENRNKKIIGVIYDSSVNDFSENDVKELCGILRLNYGDYDDWISIKVDKNSIDSSVKSFLANNNCKILIFASDDFKEYAEQLKNTNPDISINLAETQRLKSAKQNAAIAPMIVSKSQAQSTGGFYIMRGDKFVDIGKQERDNYLLSFFRSYGYTDWRHNAVMLLKDYTFPDFLDGDKMVAFSAEGVPSFYLDKVRELNYTIPVTWATAGGFMDIKDYLATSKTRENVKYPDSTLMNGESLKEKLKNENLVSLNQGDNIKLTWYKGTQYNEVDMKADYKFYKFYDRDSYDDYDENHYRLQGTLGTEGYAEYDLSGVSDGIYWIEPVSSSKNKTYRGFIQIKHNN